MASAPRCFLNASSLLFFSCSFQLLKLTNSHILSFLSWNWLTAYNSRSPPKKAGLLKILFRVASEVQGACAILFVSDCNYLFLHIDYLSIQAIFHLGKYYNCENLSQLACSLQQNTKSFLCCLPQLPILVQYHQKSIQQ